MIKLNPGQAATEKDVVSELTIQGPPPVLPSLLCSNNSSPCWYAVASLKLRFVCVQEKKPLVLRTQANRVVIDTNRIAN
jgi:hypothetical protein